METTKKKVLTRRAEIGAERRARSRLQILRASVELFGSEAGANVRLQEVCESAGVSHGTFYNHFSSMSELAQTVCEELSREFDASVNVAIRTIDDPAEQSAAALRYYLHATRHNPEWGWAMVNTALGPTFFGPTIHRNSHIVIQYGIDAGRFDLDADLARDVLLGALFTGMHRLLSGPTPDGYCEAVVERILRALGMPPARAADTARRRLPPLPSPALDEQVIVPMPSLQMPAG